MLSILILSWNTKELTRNCLKSIRDELGDFDMEVIVIDNASEDGSVEMIEKEFSEYTLVKNDVNVGFAEGNNQAYTLSKGERVLLLNSDTEVNEKAIGGMVDFLESSSDAYAAVTCRLLNVDGSTQYYMHRRFPSVFKLIPALTHKRFSWFKPKMVRDYLYLNGELEEEFDIDQGAGACLMIKKRFIEEHGLLDEKRFPIYYNDVDFCFRISKGGMKLRYLSDVAIMHVKGQSVGKLASAVNNEQYVRSSLLFFKKSGMIIDYLFLKVTFIALYVVIVVWNLILLPLRVNLSKLQDSYKLLICALVT